MKRPKRYIALHYTKGVSPTNTRHHSDRSQKENQSQSFGYLTDAHLLLRVPHWNKGGSNNSK